jgi:hypothetical protein
MSDERRPGVIEVPLGLGGLEPDIVFTCEEPTGMRVWLGVDFGSGPSQTVISVREGEAWSFGLYQGEMHPEPPETIFQISPIDTPFFAPIESIERDYTGTADRNAPDWAPKLERGRQPR